MKCGWQVKSTKSSTPVTGKRAKIPISEKLIRESHGGKEAVQALSAHATLTHELTHWTKHSMNSCILHTYYAPSLVAEDLQAESTLQDPSVAKTAVLVQANFVKCLHDNIRASTGINFSSYPDEAAYIIGKCQDEAASWIWLACVPKSNIHSCEMSLEGNFVMEAESRGRTWQ